MRRAAAVVALVCLQVAAAGAQIPPLLPDGSPPEVVLHRDDWLVRAPLSLEELLLRVAGVGAARSGGLGAPEILELAGSTNGRIQLVIDGVDFSEPDFAWPRVVPVPIGVIDSVEVVRTTDPARIAVWTRRAATEAPLVDVDLARGDLGTRTRRAQFVTPPRAIEVELVYEELLRSGDEFRPGPLTVSEPNLGRYTGRSLVARIGLHKGEDTVGITYHEGREDSDGSVASQTDRTHSDRAGGGLRWDRPLGSGHLFLDAGHLAWRRATRVGGVDSDPSDARTHAAIDLALPALGAWNPWVRLRHATTSGDATLPGQRHARFDQQRAEVQASRPGPLRFDLWGGAARDDRAGATWSARAQATLVRGRFELSARAAREAMFGGWDEPDSTLLRTALHGAASVGWRTARWDLEAGAFAKDIDGGGTAGALVPGAGPGPWRIAGGLGTGTYRTAWGPWAVLAVGSLAWTPELQGDPSGRPTLESRLDLRLSRRFRGNDLVVTAWTTWNLETQRSFPTGRVPPSALGDLALDVQFLERLSFFGGLRNLTDANVETYPGVELPSRLPWIGARARLLD
jgi:hypothetical protein